jgi:hypothetical protein
MLVAAPLSAAVACSNPKDQEIFGPTAVSPLATLHPNGSAPTASPTTATNVTPSPVPTPVVQPTPSQVAQTPTPFRTPPTPTPQVPTPTPTPEAPLVPAEATYQLYADGKLKEGFGILSWNSPAPDKAFTGRTYNDSPTLQKNLSIIVNSGDFMSIYAPGDMNLGDFTHIRFTVISMNGPESWISVSLAIQPWEPGANAAQVYVSPGGWRTFTVPLASLDTYASTKQVRGIGFRGEVGPQYNTGNTVAFGEISLVRLPDVEPPRILSVYDESANTLNLEFSEPVVDARTALFRVYSATDSAFATGPAAAVQITGESGRFVQLKTGWPLSRGTQYTLSVTGAADEEGNVAPSEMEFVANLNSFTFSVDAESDVNEFKSTMRGVAMQAGSWLWGNITDLSSPRRAALLEATSRIKPGVIRFGGSLLSNSTGWNRANAAPLDGDWTFTDPTSGKKFDYLHAYKPTMIDSYASFAATLSAETIIPVNICDNNTAMWADLVRYTNLEHDYDFKYWELGDKIDSNDCLSEFQYADRFATYSAALKAVDPTIKILGPSPSSPARNRWLDTILGHPAANPDVLSFQWYQLTDWSSNQYAWEYQVGSVDALLNCNTRAGAGCWIGFACDRTTVNPQDTDYMRYRRAIAATINDYYLQTFKLDNPQHETAITGYGPHAYSPENPVNGNHIAAIWMADVMARWAYNGLDIMVYNDLESGTSGRGLSTGLLGIDGQNVFDVRATYLAQWLYAQHFGDFMVKSQTSDPLNNVVIWANRDSSDESVLKLMLINLSGERARANLNLSGFVPTSGEVYTMSSISPLSMTNPDSFTGNWTTNNGVRIPDISVSDPAAFTSVLDSIAPQTVNTLNGISPELPPYSVAAVTLHR